MAQSKDKKVYCIHIPHKSYTEVEALLDIHGNVNTENHVRHAFDELHDGRAEKFSLEFYTTAGVTYVCFWTPNERMASLLKAAFYASMTDAEIKEFADYTDQVRAGGEVLTREIRFGRNDVMPIQDYRKFGYDSLSPIIPTLQRVKKDEHVVIQIVCEALKGGVLLAADLWLQRQKIKLWQNWTPRMMFKKDLKLEIDQRAKEKSDGKLYLVNIRVATFCDPIPGERKDQHQERVNHLRETMEQICDGYMGLNTSHGNIIKLTPIRQGDLAFRPVKERQLRNPILMMPHELVTFWHPPGLGTMPNTAQVVSRKAAPPLGLPTDEHDQNICFFGHTNWRDRIQAFGIRREDRRRHMYVVGKSGTGKSCLLQLLVRNDIEDGFGCAVLDPHGDLVDNLLKVIPKHRIKDVVLFDPSDIAFPPSFNPINAVRPELKMRVTVGFLEVFKKVIGADWSERMEHVVRYATLALLNIPTASLVSLRKMLSDDMYRALVLRQVNDESVKRFWQTEFVKNRAQFEESTISPLLNRLDQLLATDMVRNILGQPMNLFNFREFMDTRKIVLMKISKGILGNEIATLMGSLVIAKIYEAAMSRADISAESRKDFYFYIDEFQNFATDAFGEILSESRKYGLCLTLANQYLGQLQGNTRQTIFGNIGNLLSFRVSNEDAAIVAGEFKPRSSADDIKNLPLRDFLVKMSVNGEVKEAFSGRTLELRHVPEAESHSKECIDYSRSKYCVSVDKVREIMNLAEFSINKSVPAGNE